MDEELIKKYEQLTEDTDESVVISYIDFFKSDRSCNYIYEYSVLRNTVYPYILKYIDYFHVCDELYLDRLEFNLALKRKYEQYFIVLNAEYYKDIASKRDAIPYITRLYNVYRPIPFYVVLVSLMAIEIFMDQRLPNEAIPYLEQVESIIDVPNDNIDDEDIFNTYLAALEVYAALKDKNKYEYWKNKCESLLDNKNEELINALKLRMVMAHNYYTNNIDLEKTRYVLENYTTNGGVIFMLLEHSLLALKPTMSHDEFNKFVAEKIILDSFNVEKKIALYEFLFANSTFNPTDNRYYHEKYYQLLKQYHSQIYNNNMKLLKAIGAKSQIELNYIRKAYHDELTGVFNNYAFQCEITNLSSHKEYFSNNFICLMADLNGLKKINDTYGHLMGDTAIKNASKILSYVFGNHGIVFRTGGDEFTIFIRATKEEKEELIEKLVDVCREQSRKLDFDISISIGSALRAENMDLDIRELIALADKDMYHYKRMYHELKDNNDMRLLFLIDKRDYDVDGKVFRRPSARCITINDGTVAMIYSKKYNYYKFPGGGIEANESKIDALIRETKEESGLIIDKDTILPFGFVHRIQKSTIGNADVFIQDSYYYLCNILPETVKQSLDSYELEEGFTLEYVSAELAIDVNRNSNHKDADAIMIERDAKVLELLLNEGYLPKQNS